MSIPLQNGLLQIFDVDHARCALLTMPSALSGARRLPIDWGHAASFRGMRSYPGEHLQSLGVTYIDMVVFTNFDEDHMSRLQDLLSRGITVVAFWVTRPGTSL